MQHKIMPAATGCFFLAIFTASAGAEHPEVIGEDSGIPFSAGLLDGMTIVYTFVDGLTYETTFDDGQAAWRGLTGDITDQSSTGNRYAAHKLDEGVYRVRWHEERGKDDYDFVTLLLDFNKFTVFSASLMNYGDLSPGEPTVHFVPGVIHELEER